ncbi:hypothetical protein EVAR_17862_1 [Eumeta japonica]|uniref:Uncharacterized protein n=1 Tax=Eumeta variegata TaxID=151549 RepID=A0A4C2A8L5_EUMVA|nr:hypothetical protein EVAR_17862_1 [Eumeta japonica]
MYVENSIDIALVQETYLKPNRPKACSIAGYVQLRTDRTYSSALTNHVRTVVEESEREVPASSDRRKFPPDILELIRAKRSARERISHSRVQIQSASSPTRSESSRSGIPK